MGKILGHKGLMALTSFDGSFGRFALIYCLHVMSKLEEKRKMDQLEEGKPAQIMHKQLKVFET